MHQPCMTLIQNYTETVHWKKVFVQSHGMAALCKRNRALGEERKSVGKQIDVWLHKNENSESTMIKVFHWRITPRST